MAAAVFAGLLFAMHESAMADMITIGHASNGAVYRAYKIFNLTCQADKSSYAYTMEASNPFFAAVQAFAGAESNGLTLQQIGASTTYNVYFDPAVFTGAAADSSPLRAAGKAGELAAVLRKAANTLSPGELAACMAGSVTAVSDEQDGLVIDVGTDNHGYYFVTTTSGSVFSLDSAAPDITVYDKNVRPTIDKCVEDGGVYGDTNDGEIGSNANFRTYIYAGAGARGYVLHDVMDDGLRWNRDVKVYAEDPAYTGGDRISAADVIFRPVPEGSETWQVTGGAAADTAETFTIVFADAWLDSNVTEDRVLLVTYSAVITEAAVPAAAQINKT